MSGRRSGLLRVAPLASMIFGGLVLVLFFGELPLALLIGQTSFTDVSNLAPWEAMGLAFGVVGFVVARREPANPMGWLLLVASMCVLLANVAPSYAYLDYGVHGGRLPLGPVAVLLSQSYLYAFVVLPLIVFLFPDARISRRWRWVLRLYSAAALVELAGSINIGVVALGARVPVDSSGNLVGSNAPYGSAAWFDSGMKVVYAAFFAFCICSIAYQARNFRRSSGERRQQLKWLAAGGAIALAVLATAMLWKNSPGIVGNVLVPIAITGLPASIGVAILRYRLYEIDRIVSRTLAYAILTALLAGCFIGLIALTTNTLELSGRVGVAASTLAAAALFNPLRNRIQHLVDRRFNRARYDAEATVAAFTNRLRDAVEIDTIRSDLLATVKHAVQPSHASIWIKP